MNSYISSLAISFHAKLTSYLPHSHENGVDPLISASEVKKKLICQNVSIPLKKGQSICRQHIFGVFFFIFPRLRDISCSRFFWQSLFVSSARTPDSPITLASGMCVLNSDSKTGGYAQTLGWESLSWNKRISDAEHPIFLPAKMRRDDIGNVDIVDAAEEGRPNDHQYEHESKKKKKKQRKKQLLLALSKRCADVHTRGKMKRDGTSSCHQSSSLWRSAEFPETRGLAGCTPDVWSSACWSLQTAPLRSAGGPPGASPYALQDNQTDRFSINSFSSATILKEGSGIISSPVWVK